MPLCASVYQPKRVKVTKCSHFLSHNFFGLDIHFYVICLLVGIGQLDNDVLKSAHPEISIQSASQRAPLNLNVNYITVMKYTCTYQLSYKTEILKSFFFALLVGSLVDQISLVCRVYIMFLILSMVLAGLL